MNIRDDRCRYQTIDSFSLAYSLAYICTADINKRCLKDSDAMGQWRFWDPLVVSWIDYDRVVSEDILCMIPSVEGFPIVATNEKSEAMSGVVVTKML